MLLETPSDSAGVGLYSAARLPTLEQVSQRRFVARSGVETQDKVSVACKWGETGLQPKRLILFCAVAIAMVFSTGLAEAQQFSHATCRAESPNSPVRAEGLAERTGDLTFACQPTVGFFFIHPQRIITEMNVTVELNVPLGNHVNVHGIPGLTDAVLTVNQQNSWGPLPSSQSDYSVHLGPIVGTNEQPIDPGFLSECPSYLSDNIPISRPFAPIFFDPRWPCPQLATIGAVNRLVFNGVKAPFPGVDSENAGPPYNVVPSFPEVTVFEIHNIRANAAALGITGSTVGGAFVTARLTITPGNSFSLVNSVMNIATPIVGLIPEIEGPVTGLQCLSDSAHLTVTLNEGFASAFKTLGAPTFDQAVEGAWENGYPVLEGENISIDGEHVPVAVSFSPPAQNAGTGGGATQATRFIFRVFNVQPGVTVEVPEIVNNESGETRCEPDPLFAGELCIQLVTGTEPDGSGGSSAGADDGTYYTVPLDSDGNGYFVYEVGDGNPFATEDIDVDVWFSWEFDPENDEPGIGTALMDVRFAPLSDVGEPSNEPVPRFVDVGDDPVAVLTIQRCSTTLLFPFVSNRSGFDTGLVISNTSLDWKGTAPQDGRCMIHYIGNTGETGVMPDDDLSSVIPGGEQLVFTLSQGNAAREVNGAPNFQGFVIAMCEFQYAHGFAFMSDSTSGVPAWSQGYLALILGFDYEGNRVIGRQAYGVEDLSQ